MRMSAASRRELVLDVAQREFAQWGYEATTTDTIASQVGVSQPYLFRLFPSKKAMLMASINRCFDRLEARFEAAAGDLTGEAALVALGHSYKQLLNDRPILQLQLQMWALACGDIEVREVARERARRLWALVKRLSGADDVRVGQFIASGMLLNVAAALDLPPILEALGDSLAGLTGPPA
jgi:AcrR family transcriptional regulator